MMRKLCFAENKSSSIQSQKSSLRAYMQGTRAENDNRDMKEARLIDNFYQAVFQEMKGAGTRLTFFIYLSYSREAPTDRLIERLILDGHKVCCPRIDNGEMYAVEYGEDFTLSNYGIREPLGEHFAGEIDIAVIPFLAVDKQGNRLGYGGGYYDRYLRTSRARRVAFGYHFQIASKVPCEAWDEKMDVIVTDEDILLIT